MKNARFPLCMLKLPSSKYEPGFASLTCNMILSFSVILAKYNENHVKYGKSVFMTGTTSLFGLDNRTEALKCIEKVPLEPDATVWGAFLDACMILEDTNLACVASDKLYELDPENVGCIPNR